MRNLFTLRSILSVSVVSLILHVFCPVQETSALIEEEISAREVVDGTLDGEPLTLEQMKGR